MRAVRSRLRDDFPYYCEKALKIRTKDNTIESFVLNKAQLALNAAIDGQMAATGKVRIIILKARQMGLSTAVGARLYSKVSQRRASNAIVVTHHADATRALFDMTKRFHDQCPEILKPSTRYSSRKELQFDILDGGYKVATAGGDAIGRGDMFSHAHVSELAFWPKSSAASNYNGLMQAIPNSPGTEVYIESTANGISGLFYDLWVGAVKGQNGFIPVFLPWFYDSRYREPAPPGFERTEIEQALIDKHSPQGLVDDDQLQFRRLKIANAGPELWQQEYPSTAEEAFLTSGRPVFDTMKLSKMEGRDPLYRMALEGDVYRQHSRGELAVYREVDPVERYVIAADVGMGVKRDWSVAQVLDTKKRQVATWRGQVDPDHYATILLYLGRYYNEARIAVESNNHGILTCVRLGKDFSYPDFYQDTVYDKVIDAETTRLGFNTNVKTKPLIIDQLRASIRGDEIEIYDRDTLEEMRSYIVTESGAMEAERGCHDDCVMSLAIANHIHEGIWDPVVITEDMYSHYD